MDKNRGERNIMEQKNNPKISFENYRINKLLLRDLEEGEKEGQIGISIGLNDKKNQVKLGIDITTKTRFVEIEMLGVFEFDEKTPEDEKEKFLEINGAAILYPYIRAYISTITSFNKEGNALIIPTINFQSLYEERVKKQKEKSKTNTKKTNTKAK
ncbi:protein-export chaperone SecB [Leptotrichia sp. oral taxon 879]|jgi:preprotein translocase subunit secB|uniref:Protein-export chaperone SecB n=1 Tax=Leptotrichia mesophila TaxID=3239303 RepID=A0AB39V8V0_9FUSO|nr:protein-export chaperone SecB [Leptotrichia sp. oral taxon 879]ERK47704.1 putative protein-export chaperone SecB [Leptotrichia sp. oral taxon 879 str. F0557]DAX71955.1 MAG TPA: Preprotein translocase subunit SecB [Caudoviricetes sp.]